MKTLFLILGLATALQIPAQTQTCYPTPDGIDTTSMWSYKDTVLIDPLSRIDSVLLDASRPGYTVGDYDMMIFICYDSAFSYSTAIAITDFTTTTTSMYNCWYNLLSYNLTGPCVVRITAPTNAGTAWLQACFGTTTNITTSMSSIQNSAAPVIYPNPATDYISIENVDTPVMIYNSIGQILLNTKPYNNRIDISSLEKGIYFLKAEEYSESKAYKFIKD
jgi:hypothetical protein